LILNNLFKTANPAFFTGAEFQVLGARGLGLFELFNSHNFIIELSGVPNSVFTLQVVAFISDFSHCLDDLVFDEE